MRLWRISALAVLMIVFVGMFQAFGAPKDGGKPRRPNPPSQVRKTSISSPRSVPESTEEKAPAIDPKKREQLLQQLRELYPKDGFGI